MSGDGRIPIVLGVTGHRDLRVADVPAVRESLRREIAKLKKNFPSSPFYLLTGCAEGADILAAEVARTINVQIIPVLPFPINDFLLDFTSEEAQQKARVLIKESPVQIRLDPIEAGGRSDQYAKHAAYIAKHVQVVFAIWDGLGTQPDTTLKGGTADVVRMCREGVEPNALMALPEPRKVVHIFALRRSSDPQYAAANERNIGSTVVQTSTRDLDSDARIEKALEAIERFNRECLRNSGHSYSRVSSTGPVTLNGSAVDVFSQADKMASVKQRQLRAGIVWIATLALVSAFFHQVYSGPDMRVGWLLAHLITAAAALIFFRWFFRSKNRWDQLYLDARALAEGLRVQISWRKAGINAPVIDHYFVEDTDELVWLRHAISNITLIANLDDVGSSLTEVKSEWLVEQRDYFISRAFQIHRLDSRFSIVARCFLYAGLFGTFGIAVAHWFEVLTDCLNYFILLCGSLFLIAGAIKAVGDQLNFGELANRYKLMAQLFAVALVRFDVHYTSGNWDGCRDVLLNAGREALAENATWLRLHRQRQFEVSIF